MPACRGPNPLRTFAVAPPPSRLKRYAGNVALAMLATGLTLALLDVVLILTGLFPPTYNYGDAKVGWLSARPTGAMVDEGCADPTTKARVNIRRNEDAVRTSRSATELRRADSTFRIAVSGDSHTDLCAPNERTHYGVLERELTASGRPTTAFAFGAGKYSPLQAYLAVQTPITAYHANAFVLNVYTGNDFYDMLRIDDRPHFVPADTGYAIAPPVWYQEDPPGLQRRSRVLHAARLLMQATGIRRVYLRVIYLRDVARSQGEGVGSVVGYMNDLRKATAPEIGYPQSYSAQMLNQQLFFHRFPAAKGESVKRMRALLRYVRQSHPELLLVLSPLPSYQMVDQAVGDSTFRAVLARLPITFESGVKEEQELYDALRTLAAEEGWTFVDNLPTLRAYRGPAPLFNDFDYHLQPEASELIGRAQADTIRSMLRPRAPLAPPRR